MKLLVIVLIGLLPSPAFGMTRAKAAADTCECKQAKRVASGPVVRAPIPRHGERPTVRRGGSKATGSESIMGAVKRGFAFTAGARWDRECPPCSGPAGPGDPPCYDPPAPPPPGGNKDPLFVGAELRLPLGNGFTAFGNYDRDIREHGEWIKAARWNARIGLSWKPWAKEKP